MYTYVYLYMFTQESKQGGWGWGKDKYKKYEKRFEDMIATVDNWREKYVFIRTHF